MFFNNDFFTLVLKNVDILSYFLSHTAENLLEIVEVRASLEFWVVRFAGYSNFIITAFICRTWNAGFALERETVLSFCQL